jgi:hypothetical protein
MTTPCPKCEGILLRKHSGRGTNLVCSLDKNHRFVAGYESLAFQQRKEKTQGKEKKK